MNRIGWIVSLLFFISALPSHAQSFTWAVGEGGIGNEAATGVAADNDGNVYITGNLAGKADFDGTVYQGKGVYDVILAKYNASGNLLWLKTAGGKRDDQGNVIKFHNGYLYVGGYFTDSAWFENTLLVGKGDADAFVAKYDLDGQLIWVRTGGGNNTDFVTSLDVDDSGNVYAAGSYKSRMQWDSINLTTANLFAESFFCKYTADGHLLWAKTTQGNNANRISGVAHDRQQSFYLTGFFGSTFSIDSFSTASNTPSYDIFLARIGNDGNPLWLTAAGSLYEDAGNAVTVDHEGNPIITGYFSGIAHFGDNTVTYRDYNDVFVAKYNPAGQNLWVRAGKGQQLDVGYAITTDSHNNIYVTGMFQGYADFDGHGVSGTDRDIFLVSYDAYGNLRWISEAGGQDTDCGLGITVKPDGNVALCGYYLYSCSFDQIRLDFANSNDLFVAEYHPPVVSGCTEVLFDPQHCFLAFPNPTTGQLLLQEKNPTGEKTNYVLYDMQGREWQRGCFSQQQQITLSELAQGMYRLKLSTQHGTTSLPIWKR